MQITKTIRNAVLLRPQTIFVTDCYVGEGAQTTQLISDQAYGLQKKKLEKSTTGLN